jgi:multiple sugar transport system permease protein
MLKTTFVISLIFRFMDAFKSFDLIYTVTQGGPANATKTLVIQAYYESLKYYRLEIGAVIGIVLLIITFIITRFATKAIAK